MIKATELRIGNLLETPEKDIVPVDPLMLLELYQCEVAKNTGAFRYAPIPLTDEWLLKFGFKKQGIEWQIEGTEFSECFEYIGNRFYYTGGEGVIVGIGCEYVHQLQNLYYSITGEELTINSLEKAK